MLENPYLLDDLTTLGFVDEIQPSRSKTDAICILGSSNKHMMKRVEFASRLLDDGFQTNVIILLAGERYVQAGIDGTDAQLALLSDKLHKPISQLTETDLIENIYQTSKLPTYNIPSHVIDAPKGDLPRPGSKPLYKNSPCG